MAAINDIDYINATNLCKLRMAQTLIYDLTPSLMGKAVIKSWDIDPIAKNANELIEKLQKVVRTKEGK